DAGPSTLECFLVDSQPLRNAFLVCRSYSFISTGMGCNGLRSLSRVDTLQARLDGNVAISTPTTAAAVSLPRCARECRLEVGKFLGKLSRRCNISVADATIPPRKKITAFETPELSTPSTQLTRG